MEPKIKRTMPPTTEGTKTETENKSKKPKMFIHDLLCGKKIGSSLVQSKKVKEIADSSPKPCLEQVPVVINTPLIQGQPIRCKSVLPIASWQSLLSKAEVKTPQLAAETEALREKENEPSNQSEATEEQSKQSDPPVVNEVVQDDILLAAEAASNDHNYWLFSKPTEVTLEQDTLTAEGASNDPSNPSSDKEIDFQPVVYVIEDYMIDEKVEAKKKKIFKKKCDVPFCKNNSKDNPQLFFFSLTKQPVLREEFYMRLTWMYPKLKIGNAPKSGRYICQEHFNLHKDVVDLNGRPWKLKPGLFPHKIKFKKIDGKTVWFEFDPAMDQEPVMNFLVPMYNFEEKVPEHKFTSKLLKESERTEPEEIVREEPLFYSDDSESEESIKKYPSVRDSDSDNSWHGEESESEMLKEITTKSIEKGKTMKTRKDGPVTAWELLPTSFPRQTAAKKQPTKTVKKCEYCSKEINSLKYTRHMGEFHSDLTFECELCSKKFIVYKKYLDHVHHHQRYLFGTSRNVKSVPKLDLTEANIQEAKQNPEQHTTNQPSEDSDQCDPEPPEVPRVDSTDTRVPCHKCPEVLESDKHFIVHMVNHGLVYKCDFCPKTIKEWPNIYQHMQNHLGPGYENVQLKM